MENSSDSDRIDSSDNAQELVHILIRWILPIMHGK